MDKYLKIGDYFGGDVTVSSGTRERIVSAKGEVIATTPSPQVAKLAAHAINSHDELVAEVERLRLMISECYPYTKDKADWGNEYEVDLANRLFDAAK